MKIKTKKITKKISKLKKNTKSNFNQCFLRIENIEKLCNINPYPMTKKKDKKKDLNSVSFNLSDCEILAEAFTNEALKDNVSEHYRSNFKEGVRCYMEHLSRKHE